MKQATRFALYATRSSEEACDLASKFASEGEPIIVAAGGDGTLNAVVQGLAGTDSALGVIPAGTMNVFARELGIPNGQFESAFQVIEKGFIREIDLFAVNDRPFMQMAGLGFDASVIEETTWESKKLLGPLAYLLAAVKVLGEKPPMMKLTTQDGREVSGVAVLAGNGTLYGGQFPLFRKADNQDEMLDILVFQESGYRLVLDSLTNLVRGGVDLSDSVVHLKASQFTVRSDSNFPIQVDGELWGRGECAQFLPMARRLRVLAPELPTTSRFSEKMKSWWGRTKKSEERL